MDNSTETFFTSLNANTLFRITTDFNSNINFDYKYREYFESRPYETFKELIITYFVKTGDFNEIHNISVYDVINRYFPDYFHDVEYVRLLYHMLNSMGNGFVIKNVKQFNWGIGKSYITVDDVDEFYEIFMHKYPEMKDQGIFDLNSCEAHDDQTTLLHISWGNYNRNQQTC